MTTQEAIEFAKIRLNNIGRGEKYLATKNEKIPLEQQQYKEFYKCFLQIAERAGDEEEIIKIAINSLEKVYGYLKGYRESNVINAFREELAHSLSKWLRGEDE